MANKKNVNNYSGEVNIKEGVILVVAIFIIVLVIYGLTVLAQRIGLFDEGYVKPEISNAVISYENSIAGTIFNKADSEYYVVLYDSLKNDGIYLSSLVSLYNQKDSHLPVYTVDLGNHFNKSIVGETSNPSAQSVNDLSISEPTLIYIKDGRNYRYITGGENFKTEFGL